MNSDLTNIATNLANTVLANRGEQGQRNAVLVSQHGTNIRDPGFLSHDFRKTFHAPPRLYFTAEDDEFDSTTLSEWQNAGFTVEYFPMGKGGASYTKKLESLFSKPLEIGETFGIIAFGDAAGACLEHFHIIDNNHDNKLGVLVAYYPNIIPDPRAAFPSTMKVVVHLAGDEVGEVHHSQLAGVEGKRKVVRHDLKDAPGKGKKLDFAYPCYKYDAEPGFAERDLDVYDGESAMKAQDRTLKAVKAAFSV
ncbi:hypothetical protein KVR01_007321 [Diaporthe batatas]|uniref:uncharacterized protein n=1 Tax=Diaporthe batatas TaxID=748121 RepID=UPI001D04D972|nr:uncharacterized protein KVR01_007321 [Diaporthe batatas]KAG8162843.1 hypothetical protein KVR01_007321 [Diaporthe batatas]